MTYYVITSANSINYTTSSTLISAQDIAEGDSLFVDKDGYVMATGADTTGVYVNAYATGAMVTVNGLVMGTRTGIYSLGTDAQITVYGQVVSNSYAIQMENRGYLYVGTTGQVTGSTGVAMGSEVTLINDGTINGIGNDAIQFSGGWIHNNGLITSRGWSLTYTADAAGYIINTGTIVGDLEVYYAATAETAKLTIENSGNWLGDINLTPGDDSVTNTGKIDGDVHMGTGNDVLDSRYGLITGTISAGAGNDSIKAGAEDDTIDGGAGADTINGGGGHNIISYNNSTVGVKINLITGTAHFGEASGDKLKNIHDVSGTLYKDVLTGDDGDNDLSGVLGKDRLTGNGGNDTFTLLGTGTAIISGGSGNDLMQIITFDQALYGFAFSAANKIDGGSGYDTLELTNFGSVSLTATTLTNVERILLQDGFDYSLTTHDATVAKNKVMEVDASVLTGTFPLIFDGSKEKDGAFDFEGGAGADVFKGGKGADHIGGNGAADTMTGGGGSDVFVYNSGSDSLFDTRDSITDFKAGTDNLEFDTAVKGIDGTMNGAVSQASDLVGLLTGQLEAQHAIIVKVNGGTLDGRTLLVVDQDGIAGYDALSDYVIDIKGISGNLSMGDFLV